MPLGNAQFDAIMREYDNRRLKNRHIFEERKGEVYDFIPEYKMIDERMADLARETAFKAINGDKSAMEEMSGKIAKFVERKKELLAQFNFPEDYLEPVYTCPDCKDTGYVNGQKCHCLTREIIRAMYKQSNIEEVLEEENFDNLSYDFYNDSEVDSMRKIVQTCKNFVYDFDSKYENILLYGNVGVGKTYLTNCIAKALLDSGHSVIYFTSYQLFDTLAKYVFRREDGEMDVQGIHRDIFDCDLLIIDDLGTETVNSFVSSQLFLILNERNMRKRSTVISTNLSLEKLNEEYSQRSFSRIFGNYILIKPDIEDIRIKKRKQTVS